MKGQNTNYEEKVRRLDWQGLRVLWEKIKDRKTPGWPPGKALEYLVVRAFELGGATVKYPYSVNFRGEEIEQIDGAIHFNGLHCLLESKDFGEKSPVNVAPIAKLRIQLMRRPGFSIGCIFSCSGFTDQAITLAEFIAPHSIMLWNADEIEFSLKKEDICNGLDWKVRMLVEEGKPNFRINI